MIGSEAEDTMDINDDPLYVHDRFGPITVYAHSDYAFKIDENILRNSYWPGMFEFIALLFIR